MQLYLIHHRVPPEISTHRELDPLTDELVNRTERDASSPYDETMPSYHL